MSDTAIMLDIVEKIADACDNTDSNIITEQAMPSINAISPFFGLSVTTKITVVTANTQIVITFILKTKQLLYCSE